jgi:hypothetical protein
VRGSYASKRAGTLEVSILRRRKEIDGKTT